MNGCKPVFLGARENAGSLIGEERDDEENRDDN